MRNFRNVSSQVKSSVLSDPRDEARAIIARRFLGTSALVSVCGAALVATSALLSPAYRIGMAAGFVLLGLFAAIATRWRGAAAQQAVVTVNVCGLAIVGVTAGLSGLGLSAPATGFLVLFTLVIGATVGARPAILTASLSVAVLLALAWGEQAQWIRGVAALAEMPIERRLYSQLLMIAVGLAGGLLVERVITHYMRGSDEREARFIGLLGIAADTYWEMDRGFTTTQVWKRGEENRFVPAEQAIKTPWEQAGCEVDDALLEGHRVDLAAQRPFRNLHARWRNADGSIRHELISGEPRFDAQRRFIGYWGVTRDVTTDVQLQRAMQATEARYQELFKASPLALVIHRDWTVIDANPAAVVLFGYDNRMAMSGEYMLQFLPPTQHDRAHERLHAALGGRQLQPALYKAVMRDGRQLTLRAMTTRIDHDDQSLALTIYDDVTELVDAQEALRRSEAMLSHLVTTSPDLITLTELATGRYVMVNDTFTQFTGFTREQAIGHTALELGLWGDPAERAAFIAEIRQHGVVRHRPQEFVAKSGSRFSLLLSAASFELEGGKYLVLNGRDITDSERTRLAHEAVLQNASLGIAFTREQKFVQANPALEQMLGWARGTLTGQAGRVVWSSDAEYAEVGRLIRPALAKGEQVELVRELRRRDGSAFWCRMLAKVVDTAHPMRGGTIWIVEDITERRQVEQALAKARDDAESANRAKSAFLANTSHEIRTPLNGLVGLARLARRPELDEAKRRQYLDQIGDSAETLTAVISDVLDLSKIESGKLLIENIVFDLRSLLESLARVYGTLADARGLGFEFQLDEAVPQHVRGDPVRLRQILSNYLNNALKFTVRGRITLAARKVPVAGVRFEVSDTGLGIDSQTQLRLFNPFIQADQSMTRRFGGTGLGLAICRELALLMDGQVGVNSVHNEGSRFWAELPLPPAAAPLLAAGGESDSAASPLVGARVLMAEDNAVNMMIAVALLEQWGVRVSQVSDGAQAIEAVEQAALSGQPFDAVLMDVQMPVMSGYEATRLLRRRFSAQALPIIALTAAALTSERELALQSGMNDFLTKPIDPQRLRDTLATTLSARGTDDG